AIITWTTSASISACRSPPGTSRCCPAERSGMAARERIAPWVAAVLSGRAAGGRAPPDARGDAPVLSAEDRDALAALHYDDGAPPDDPSNRVADDATARAFGQRLFFETACSGPLLEGDNDGTSATLGRQGESGRVSCAG